VWAAIAAGIVVVPALFGGVAAAPAHPNDTLPPPDLDPRETPPPDRAQMEAMLVLAQADAISDLAPDEYRLLTVQAAIKYKLDPRLLAAIATVETRWNPLVVGSYGELGLMQILPATGKYLVEQAGLTEYDLADPATSLNLGAMYLSELLREYGNVESALAAYNGGPNAVETASVNLYARKVLKVYRTRKTVPRFIEAAS
jgi:soluble lytic murein transglycosylase-like protein